MAMLNDTVIRGALDVFDSYYITEQKRNFASIRDGVLYLGDPTWGLTLEGIDVTINASKNVYVNATKDVKTLRMILLKNLLMVEEVLKLKEIFLKLQAMVKRLLLLTEI